MVLVGVSLVSLVLGAVLMQGLILAAEAQRQDLILQAGLGLGLLLILELFSIVLTRRQHRILDEAREEMEELVRKSPGF
jgi:hypothetical protein